MKFSLWVERREKRNQRSATKTPVRKSNLEVKKQGASARIHAMAGQGDSRSYGKSGQSPSEKDKALSRSKSKENWKKQERTAD